MRPEAGVISAKFQKLRAVARHLARERARIIPEFQKLEDLGKFSLINIEFGRAKSPIAICARTKRDQPKGWSRVNQQVKMDGTSSSKRDQP